MSARARDLRFASHAALCGALLLGCGDDGPRGIVQVVAPPSASTGQPGPDDPPTITKPWVSIGPAPPAVQAPIAVHAPSGTIYVGSFGGGVFKSTDFGRSFNAVNNGLSPLTVTVMGMAANDPNTLYVSAFGGPTYKTTDGGANWTATGGNSAAAPLFLLVDPANANNVWIGLNGAVPIRRSTDGGASWSDATGIPANSPVFSLAIDPRDSRVLYAGSAGAGAFKSTNGGASWSALNVDTTVWAVYVDPDDSNTVYAGGNGSGVFRSVDAGATFTRLGAVDSPVLAIAKANGALYASTTSAGVLMSINAGRDWIGTGLVDSLAISLSVDARGMVYVGTGSRGAYEAPGGSAQFTPLASASLLTCNCQNVYYASVDPSNSRHVMLGTNDGGLIQTFNGGRTWVGARGFDNRSPRAIVFDPVDPRRVYAGSFTGGGLFVSTDGGLNWQRRLFGPPTIHVAGVAVDPSDRSVYVITLQNGGAWKSTDFGASFTRIDVATPGGAFLNLAGRGIAVDPSTPSTVYVAGPTGTWQSRDRGATWTRVSTIAALSVAVDPTSSRNVYVGTNTNGVLKSTDGGASFAPANVGLTDLRMSRAGAVQIHRSDPNTLYVGTEGGGVFRSTDAGGSWTALNDSLDERVVFGLAMDPRDPNVLYATGPQSVFKTISGGR